MEIRLSTSKGQIVQVCLIESDTHQVQYESGFDRSNPRASTRSKMNLFSPSRITWVGPPIYSALKWIEHYFTKNESPNFLPPLDETQFASPKIRDVCMKLYEIPFGTTISYKEFAKRAGMDGAQRAVGTILGKNPFALFLPCHRVIKADGTLGGFLFGLTLKQSLLSFEKLIRS